MQRKVRVNRAIGQYVNFVKFLPVSEDDLAFLEEFLLQLVDKGFKRLRAQFLEVDDLEDLALEPLLVLVLVLDEAVVQFLLDVGENVQQLLKVVLTDHTDGGVVLGLDRRCTLRVRQERNLSEVLARLQHTNETLFSLLVLDPALAFALSDDEKVKRCFTLLDLDLLRLAHDEFDFSDHVVLDLGVERKDQVLLELLGEDEPRDFFFQARADHLEEFTKLILMVERLLDVLQV